MDGNASRIPRLLTESGLTAILVAAALVGPAVAYASVDVVWPASRKTIDVNQDPPITFDTGTDYELAKNNNFTGDFVGHNNNASYTVTVSGLSGGRVTIDKLLNLTILDSVSSFNVEISSALSGSFDDANITQLRMRIWNGSTAPTDDSSPGVRCVLDLEQPTGNDTSGYAPGECELPGDSVGPGQRRAYMQIVFELADDQTTESATVDIRPLDIVFQ